MSLVIVQTVWVGKRIAIARQTGKVMSAALVNEEFPENYPQTNRPAPDFELLDQHGETISLKKLRGQTIYLTFAFAHCKTICPTLVHTIKNALNPNEPENVKLLIVTLDPWRDRPSSLPSIAKEWQLPKEARILSGEVSNVTQVHKLYGMPALRDEKTGDISHPGLVFVIDKKGRIAYTFNNPSPSVLIEAHRRIKEKPTT